MLLPVGDTELNFHEARTEAVPGDMARRGEDGFERLVCGPAGSQEGKGGEDNEVLTWLPEVCVHVDGDEEPGGEGLGMNRDDELT